MTMPAQKPGKSEQSVGTPRAKNRSPYERVISRCVRVGGCLVFQGAKHPSGYGKVGVGGRTLFVHRVVFEHVCGPIEAGLELDHVAARGCTSRACCEIAHLEPVTHTENRRRSRRPFCAHGHRMEGNNVIERGPQKGPACRQCANNDQRRRRARIASEQLL